MWQQNGYLVFYACSSTKLRFLRLHKMKIWLSLSVDISSEIDHIELGFSIFDFLSTGDYKRVSHFFKYILVIFK